MPVAQTRSSPRVPGNATPARDGPGALSGRVTFLDSLRFVAAAAVVFQHVVELQGAAGEYVVGLLSPGVFGVVLFFIISGFVIPMSARGRFDLRTFVVRRIFRIYPLVLATFVLLAILGYAGLGEAFGYVRAATAGDWIANLLLVQDYVGATPLWGVTWTLSLEAAWYVVFACAFLYSGPRFDRWLVLVFPAIMLTLALGSILADQRLPLARLNMLYAAVIGCRIYRHWSGELEIRRLLADIGGFMLVGLVCNLVSFGYFVHPNITLNQAVFPWLAATLLFAFVTLVPRVRDSRLSSSRVLSWLGSISFSTYLLHGFAMGIAASLASGPYVPVLSLALTLAFSALGYYLVEVPGQSLGRAIAKSMEARNGARLTLRGSKV